MFRSGLAVVAAIMLNNIAMLGYDPLMAAGSIGGFVGVSQGLAVILRTKSDKTRTLPSRPPSRSSLA